jgi:hypothetical protein
VRSVTKAEASGEFFRSIVMDVVAGSLYGTCSDGGSTYVVVGVESYKNHNQRRLTTNEMAMEHAPRPHAWSGRPPVLVSKHLCHGRKILVHFPLPSKVVELSPLSRQNKHNHRRCRICTPATLKLMCNMLC